MNSLFPFGVFIVALVVYLVGIGILVLVGYWVIRLAVRHGMIDAQHRLWTTPSPPVHPAGRPRQDDVAKGDDT